MLLGLLGGIGSAIAGAAGSVGSSVASAFGGSGGQGGGGGGSGILPGVISGLFGMGAQDSANQANAREAQLNREFQERMANTGYQRMVADLKAAGLNPMMAMNAGAAATPGGAQARYESMGPALQQAVGTALEGRRMEAVVENIEQDTANKELTAKAQKAELDATQATAKLTEEQAKNRARVEKQLGKYGAYADYISDLAGKIFGGAGAAKKVFRGGARGKETIIDGRTGEVLHER